MLCLLLLYHLSLILIVTLVTNIIGSMLYQ